MSDSVYAQRNVFQFSGRRAIEHDARRQTQYDAIGSELQAAFTREKAWLREKSDLLQRHDALAKEFEHRLANSLQIIVSALSLQSRIANPEAAAQLMVAANRVATFARVHRRLHELDHQASVEFKRYLQQLCEELSGLLLDSETDRRITVEAAEIHIPTALAIPLALILNELITNSAKYAKTHITVRLESSSIMGHSLSVSDDGPGLPEAFDPARSKGLGMKIIATLVKQIGGALQIGPGDEGHGTRFTIKFNPLLPVVRSCSHA
jgi:two-component system, sensor histidine kinase PdtaS